MNVSRPQFLHNPVEKCGKPAESDEGCSSSVLYPSGNSDNLALLTDPRKDIDDSAND